MGRIIEKIVTNAKNHKKQMNSKDSTDNRLADIAFDKVVRRMTKESETRGKTEFTFIPSTIPLAVDKMLRDEGFVVWRNSEIFKVVVPMEDK